MTVISLDTIIECCNDLVDETEALRDRMDILERTANNNIDRLTAQLQAANKRIDELTEQIVVLKRTEEVAQQTVVEKQTVSLKRLPRRTLVEEKQTVESAPTEAVAHAPSPAPQTVMEETVAPVMEETVAPEPAPTPQNEIDVLMDVVQTAQKKQTAAPSTATSTKRTVAPSTAPKTAIAKRAMARQYMIETGMGVEQLRNPTAISEVLASPEFEAWLEKK